MPTNDESIQVWVVRLGEQSAESWRPVLSSAEWDKAMRFLFPVDQVRSAVTRGVLRTLLARYLAVPAAEIEFTQNEFGKPAIAGGGIEFNVSHSGDYALLGFSKSAPIGVDVEKIAGKRVIGDLAKRVLTPSEYERFTSLTEVHRERTFFEIWTLKESIMKGIGSGLSVAPESIEVTFHPKEPKLLSTSFGPWSLATLNLGDPAYAAAIAVQQEAPPPIEINHFGATQVISSPSAQRL